MRETIFGEEVLSLLIESCVSQGTKEEKMIMIAKQRGEGAHLLDALWFRASGDVANLRRLHLHCRNIGHKIVEHEISEMIEYLEESKTKETTGARKARLVIS